MEPHKDNPQEEDFVAGQNEYAQLEQSTEDQNNEVEAKRAENVHITVGALAKELGRSYEAIRKAVDSAREADPNSVVVYENWRGENILITPVLANQIREAAAEWPKEAEEGWMSRKALTVLLSVDQSTIDKHIADLQPQYPEDFDNRTVHGRLAVVVSPRIVDILKDELGIPEMPENWLGEKDIAKLLGRGTETVRPILKEIADERPDLSQDSRAKNGIRRLAYAPEVVELVKEKLPELIEPPAGWVGVKELSESFDRPKAFQNLLKKAIEKFPEQYGKFLDRSKQKKNITAPFCGPQIVEFIQTSLEEVAEAPEGWVPIKEVADSLGKTYRFILNKAHQLSEGDDSQIGLYLNKKGQKSQHFSPELIERIKKFMEQIPEAPPDWRTLSSIAKDLRIGRDYAASLAEQVAPNFPNDWGDRLTERGAINPMYSPAFALAIKEAHEAAGSLLPEGWITINQLKDKIGSTFFLVSKAAERYREIHPEWFRFGRQPLAAGKGSGRVHEHLSPELVELISAEIRDRKGNSGESLNVKLESFLADVVGEDSLEAAEFRKLTEIFGGERVIDLIYQHHPEFAGVPVPQAKRIIGDYLGEFLVQRGALQLEDLELAGKYLTNPNLKEALTEVVKQDCLRFYNAAKRANPGEDDRILLQGYITHLQERTASLENQDMNEVLAEVGSYYESLFTDIHKPDSVIDELKTDRMFPDINQRINIHELAAKQKILIADEMGLGKSASAILAKETLGAKQALILVPSNVEDTWSTYLSDKSNVGGQVAGYFKEGQGPRVLMVDSVETLNSADPKAFDYILMSQERLTDDYAEALEKFNFDMMVVDESHKLKNLSSGKRAENLLKLSEKIQGDDKYLALLSGTPIPNKVGDIAMTLRLLYPEKFAETPGNELVNQIINGDALDLRSLLVPRMQMKSLAESVEMPKLTQEDRIVELSEQEKNIYDVLLQEDELTAAEKLQILRQFVMNPELLEATPDIESSKVKTVRDDLIETFGEKDKVVMFVNGYVEGVIRGDGTIIKQLGLPEEIQIRVIEGDVPRDEREQIRLELQQPGKMLLLVSGQTADVGVDFSAADAVRFYNEPWTEYEKRQQLARVYRPGLETDLDSKTFYVKGTVEEGIHYYIQAKYRAVEKLLRGIPVSEIEAEMLRKAEKQTGPNLEVDSELAESYFSSFDKMMKIYGHVKEMGEEKFTEFLSKYGREYADAYEEMGSRSYQANASRLAGTLINDFVEEQDKRPGEVRILDVASGPEMLRRHIPERLAPDVISVDINEHHFAEAGGKRAVGSFLSLPIANSSVDYANLSLALHYTSFAPSKGKIERVEALQEINRVLKTGGRAVVSLMYTLDVKDEHAFKGAVESLGFEIVEANSGEAESGSHYRSKVYTLEKTRTCSEDTAKVLQEMGKNAEGLKFKQRKNKLRDSARIVTEFVLGDRIIAAKLNAADRATLEEERQIMSEMEDLKSEYGEVKAIPADILTKLGLSRIRLKKSYVIFKRLQKGPGAVVYRDTTKWAESSEEDPALQGVAATAS